MLTTPVLDLGLFWALPLESSFCSHSWSLLVSFLAQVLMVSVTLEEGQAEVWMSPVGLIMNTESFHVTGIQFGPVGRM